MKTILFVLVAILFSGIAFCQSSNPGKLSGSVTDSTTAKPVPYVTVAFMEGTKLITGTTSEEDGSFLLANLPLSTYTYTLLCRLP